MIHTVYTRQRYDDEEELDYRMRLARATTIPSMVEAARKATHPVRWCWFSLERDHELIHDVLRRSGYPGPVRTIDVWPPAPLKADDVQSTLDSDDKVAPHFLQLVQRRWRPDADTYIVTWQPIKERFGDGVLFQHRMKYARDRPSPFYAVYNPTEEIHAYAKSHGHMHELGAPVELSRERGAIAVIHGRNKLMDLRSGDTRIEKRARPKKTKKAKRSKKRRRGRGRKGE